MVYPVWVNGSGGCIDPADRGLAYGDGLFETMRIEGGRAVLYEAHVARLLAGAARLDISLDIAGLREDIARFLSICPGRCVAKVIVTRGSSGRGYLPDPSARPSLIFSAHPLPEYPSEFQTDGIHAGVCSLRLGEQPGLAGIKHLNRLEQVLLRRELEDIGKQEALVCTSRGLVIEGVFSNVFMIRNGNLHTPLIDTAGVCGVLRAAILQRAAERNASAVEGHYTVDDFLSADEVFFCNSVNGIWPVQSLAGRHWIPGPVTRYWQAFWQEQF